MYSGCIVSRKPLPVCTSFNEALCFFFACLFVFPCCSPVKTFELDCFIIHFCVCFMTDTSIAPKTISPAIVENSVQLRKKVNRKLRLKSNRSLRFGSVEMLADMSQSPSKPDTRQSNPRASMLKSMWTPKIMFDISADNEVNVANQIEIAEEPSTAEKPNRPHDPLAFYKPTPPTAAPDLLPY